MNELSSALEEKIFYHLSEAEEFEMVADSIQELGRKFIKQGLLNMLIEFMQRLTNSGHTRPIFEIFKGDIAQIKTEWSKALSHFNNTIKYDFNDKLKAEGTIKYGEILFRKGDVRESLPYFEDSVRFAKNKGLQSEEARALNDIGLVYHTFTRYDEAVSKFIEALRIRKTINDEEGIASTLNNLGNVYSDTRKFEKALEYYNASLKINEELYNKTEISLNLSNIAILLSRQNINEEALEKLNASMKLQDSIGDKEIISRCLNTYGVIYMMQDKKDLAIAKYEESIALNLEVGDKVGLASTYSNFGVFYTRIKNYGKALEYYFKSLELVNQIGSRSDEQSLKNSISDIRNTLGKQRFKEIAQQVYSDLGIEIKKNIEIEEFTHEPIKNKTPKVGRNDPCYCGSGKKFKHCHGRLT